MDRLLALTLSLALLSCGGGGPSSGTPDSEPLPEEEASTLSLTVGLEWHHEIGLPGVPLSIDEGLLTADANEDGHATFRGVPDGDHVLRVHRPEGGTMDVPFRMTVGRPLSLGTLLVHEDGTASHSGFDGYQFAFVDADEDGLNDLFADANGDGICDAGKPYADYPYAMPLGYSDLDGDGKNDRFADADGDGANDLDGHPYSHGFGFRDADGDGQNDLFTDMDGDGICDRTGVPFAHPFGYEDADGDGLNDRFRDADGDSVNDLTGETYHAMPGWVDLDHDEMNDFFRDLDGDGRNDLDPAGAGYAHGFGWRDADGDGVNDLYVDADGDGRNDLTTGDYAGTVNGHGHSIPEPDANGDGISDASGMPYRHGFGWVDLDADGTNDVFVDANADGINDRTGRSYGHGYSHEQEPTDQAPAHDDWPMHGGMGS